MILYINLGFALLALPPLLVARLLISGHPGRTLRARISTRPH